MSSEEARRKLPGIAWVNAMGFGLVLLVMFGFVIAGMERIATTVLVAGLAVFVVLPVRALIRSREIRADYLWPFVLALGIYAVGVTVPNLVFDIGLPYSGFLAMIAATPFWVYLEKILTAFYRGGQAPTAQFE